MRRIKTFTDRYPLIGPAVWILSWQYFLAQLVVSLQWRPPYNWGKNTISDLGNTACGIYDHRYVCSSLHPLMNLSFILLGLTIMMGSLLIYQEFRQSKLSLVGFTLMALAGAGSIIVGLFPENSVGWLHILGASLPFGLGNLSLLVLGRSLPIPPSLRAYTVVSGVVAVMAGLFLLSRHYLGLGLGGMERLTAYPQTIWLIVFGLYMSKNHFARAKAK